MKTYAKSLFELTAVTYAVTFLGLVLSDGFDLMSLSSLRSAAVASIPAGLAVLYGALARFKGNYASALAVDTRPKGSER